VTGVLSTTVVDRYFLLTVAGGCCCCTREPAWLGSADRWPVDLPPSACCCPSHNARRRCRAVLGVPADMADALPGERVVSPSRVCSVCTRDANVSAAAMRHCLIWLARLAVPSVNLSVSVCIRLNVYTWALSFVPRVNRCRGCPLSDFVMCSLVLCSLVSSCRLVFFFSC